MGNILSKIGAGLSGFGAGIQDPSFAIKQAEEKRKQQELQQLLPILSGQSIPQFLRPGGAESISTGGAATPAIGAIGSFGDTSGYEITGTIVTFRTRAATTQTSKRCRLDSKDL